jgi:Rrf2 family transcriptional regulator, nitric oxide-sensitive transcriptional repressor
MYSATAEYALRAVVYLAQKSPTSCTTEQISDSTGVPAAYLSKILQNMRNAGIVKTKRGSKGGVTLEGDLQVMSILDIIRAVDPIERIGKCPLGGPEHSKLCPLHSRLDRAMAQLEEEFRTTMVASLIEEEEGNTCPFPFPNSQASDDEALVDLKCPAQPTMEVSNEAQKDEIVEQRAQCGEQSAECGERKAESGGQEAEN